MTNPGKNEYLQSKVMTASPAQLHLMLIEGALRFGREAEKAMMRDDEEAAAPFSLRTLDIVEELLASVRHSEDDVNVKLAQLYLFIYTRVTSAYVNTDHEAMAEALRVLEFERETWRMACEKTQGVTSDEPEPDSTVPAPKGGRAKAAAPSLDLASGSEGLHLEA